MPKFQVVHVYEVDVPEGVEHMKQHSEALRMTKHVDEHGNGPGVRNEGVYVGPPGGVSVTSLGPKK